MKIIFLITIVILIQANNHDLRAQLSRIDRYGKVEINLKEQENREIKDTITLQNQVTLEVGSKTVLTYKTKPKKKLFHPPLKKMIPTSQFGMRVHPVSGTRKMHTGIDLKAWYEPVYSIADGIVKYAGWGNREGYYVIINHGEVESVYCHLSEISRIMGDTIKAGDVLGISGNTGSSTGPHLHFGLKWKNGKVNPERLLESLNVKGHFLYSVLSIY